MRASEVSMFAGGQQKSEFWRQRPGSPLFPRPASRSFRLRYQNAEPAQTPVPRQASADEVLRQLREAPEHHQHGAQPPQKHHRTPLLCTGSRAMISALTLGRLAVAPAGQRGRKPGTLRAMFFDHGVRSGHARCNKRWFTRMTS